MNAMKKIYSIIFAAAAIFAASSCQEEIVEPDLGTQENESMTITAGFGAETKTVLDGLKTYWTEGDQISVFDSNKKESDTDEGNNRCFSIDETATTFEDGKAASATFKYDGEFVWPQNNQPDPLVVALYPYQENAYCDFFYYDRNYITGLNIPVQQVALEGGFDANATFALATSKYSESDNLTFTNLYSLLRITINEDDVKEVKVSVEGGKIAGEAKVQLNLEMEDENTPVFDGGTLSATENGANTVTLTCEDGFVAGKDYYIAIAPVTYTNIKVYLDDVLVKDTTPEGGKTLEANTVYNISNLDDPHTVADGVYLNDKGVYEISNVDGLKWLSGQTDGMVTEVKIVEDIEFSEEFWVKQNLTIDLGEKTLTGTASRFIRVASDTDETIEVTIKNGEVLNNKNGGRCIETRSGNVTLNLEGVTLSTPSNGANQPLTIGGSGDNITVNIENSTITTNNVSGYAITTFNPVTLNIDNSEVSGWSVLYVKGADSSLGSAGSEFNITKSTLTGTNDVAQGESNSFSTIMIDTDDITVYVDGESTINTVANTNAHILLGLVNATSNPDGVKNVNVTFDGTTINLEGEKAEYLSMIPGSDNVVKFPSQYADELVEELAEEGMTVSEPENDLVTIIPEPVKSERNLAFAQESGTATYGDEFTLPELTGEGDLTKAVYAVTDGEAATVTEGGVVTLVKAGTVTIKATVAEDDTHLAGEATYTITVNKAARTISFSGEGNYTATLGDDFEEPTLTVDPEAVVVYSVEGDAAEVAEDGTVTLKKAGTATVTATVAATETHNEATASYTITVYDLVTVYLKPNSNWKVDNARFAARLWYDGGPDLWVDMTDEDGDGIYEAEFSSMYTYVIFCRMNPNEKENCWDNKWNQTSDLTVPNDDTNYFVVKKGSWDKGTEDEWMNEQDAKAYVEPEDPAPTTRIIYFKVGDWSADSAYFEAWTWGGTTSDSWVKFEPTSESGIYSAEIPSDRTGMKVLRKDPNHASETWDSWNDSGNQDIPSDKNMLIFNGWNNQTFSWGTK